MNLSVEEVRALLQRAVDEKGADYVYPESDKRDTRNNGAPICQYFIDGRPSCIVGHVLRYAGVYEVTEGQSAQRATEGIVGSLSVRRALSEAQTVQDHGKTWGEALAAFDKAVQHVD